jgi:hypothetical protein
MHISIYPYIHIIYIYVYINCRNVVSRGRYILEIFATLRFLRLVIQAELMSVPQVPWRCIMLMQCKSQRPWEGTSSLRWRNADDAESLFANASLCATVTDVQSVLFTFIVYLFFYTFSTFLISPKFKPNIER